MLCVLAVLSLFAAVEGPMQVTATVIRPVLLRVSADGAVVLARGSLPGGTRMPEPRIARRPGLVSIDF